MFIEGAFQATQLQARMAPRATIPFGQMSYLRQTSPLIYKTAVFIWGPAFALSRRHIVSTPVEYDARLVHSISPRRERLGRGVARVARGATARRSRRNGVGLVEMPSRARARTPHARPRLNRSESASCAIARWRSTRLNAAPTGRATHRKFGEGDKNEIAISRRVSTP